MRKNAPSLKQDDVFPMENRPTDEKPLDIEVFVPDSVELIDPARGFAEFRPLPPQRAIRSRKRLALFLFLATCATTFFVGAMMSDKEDTLYRVLQNGLTYSAAVMLILTAHEMGHYLQARRYGVPASLPYFIPMPLPPLGTMGAVIIQGVEVIDDDETDAVDQPRLNPSEEPRAKPARKRRRIICLADRKQMFDIAISGPLAGLVFALPILYLGVSRATVAAASGDPGGFILGEPLIFQWIAAWAQPDLGARDVLTIGPLGMAGWVGILITALNLIPIGQLDGGHILYTLIGKRAHYVATALLIGATVYLIATRSEAYILMVILLFLMGPRHPPTRDDAVPLGTFRIILGWLTLAFIFIGFTPTPIIVSG
ncbi:MAG: site-2 protease family protein [Planctomycetaceae bacterium]